jgi:hypothetical protein
VYELMNDIVSAGVEQTVPKTLIMTVKAVEELSKTNPATIRQVAEMLKIDRSSAWRRLNQCLPRG